MNAWDHYYIKRKEWKEDCMTLNRMPRMRWLPQRIVETRYIDRILDNFLTVLPSFTPAFLHLVDYFIYKLGISTILGISIVVQIGCVVVFVWSHSGIAIIRRG